MTTTPINILQRAAFHFLWNGANPENGLVPDQISPTENGEIHRSPASVAVTGMALSALPVATENGWVSRHDAATRALKTLRFFARDAEEFGGFFFHFLDLESGKRVWKCEVSSIDSAFLFLGALFCEAYFDKKSGAENEIRELSQQIFARADWTWFCHGQDAVSVAYKPDAYHANGGFSKHMWRGYNEALPLALLALGAPNPLPVSSYNAWTQTYHLKTVYEREHLFCGPLFTHLFPHMWLDLLGLFDEPLQSHGFDYFQNTIRAIEIQREWARKRGDERKWGVSACDAPQDLKLGGYRARGVPFGRFDEVFSPPVCLASLPFSPEIALESWNFWAENYPGLVGEWGVRGGLHVPSGWMSAFFGLDQGMLVLLLENANSGLLWELSRQIKPLQLGLKRAGFHKK